MANTAAARSDESPPDAHETPTAKFAELRTLLVGPEQRQLRALQTRLDDPVTHAREVSRVLPAAVELGTKDPQLKRALAPTIEETISSSVRRNPQPLADALFPIIGPAIRKAIAATLSGMLESLNTTLEHSLSWRSLRWRLDARRTGKSFAEIVLLNTLVYRVEQVFLIHQPSGLLLQHLSTAGTETQDGDMVSGMLSAIRDFVRDSFHVSGEESVQTLQVGELSVWIEQGPHAMVAAVIRGTAPPDLRVALQQAIEGVHAQYSDLLESFDGEAAKFEGARPLLEACLRQQYRTRERGRVTPAIWIVVAILVFALGLWIVVSLRARGRWQGYLDALRGEPGIVVVSATREGGRYVVNGLRDPLARDPASLLPAHGLRTADVMGRWELYQALHPSLVLARARQLLKPPPGAHLQFADGVLSATGAASLAWLETAMRIAPAVPGVTRFDATALVEAEARTVAAAIEGAALLFVKGTASLAAGGEQVVRDQLDRLRSLDAVGRIGDRTFAVELVGEADSDGAPETNLPLSQQRAARVLEMLPVQAFTRVRLSARGIGSRAAADALVPDEVKQRNRRVSFRVTPAEGGR